MTVTLPRPVGAAIAAANAGDTEAYLDLFIPDGYVDDWGRVFTGRDRIRAWSQAEFIGVAATLAVISARTDGDVTVVTAQVGGNGFNGPSDFAFRVKGDSLVSMTITG
jgi:uncharacterized protein (TIGR02246 family)